MKIELDERSIRYWGLAFRKFKVPRKPRPAGRQGRWWIVGRDAK